MAKKKVKEKKSEASSSDVKRLETWDDVFLECASVCKRMEEYESYVEKWEKNRHGSDTLAAQEAYHKRHDRCFWKQQSILSTSQLRKVLLWLIIGLIGGFVVGNIVHFVQAHAFEPMSGVLFAVIGFIIGAAIGVIPTIGYDKMLEGKMAKLEPTLAEVLRYIPPKFRNSWCVFNIGDARVSYGVSSYEKMIDALDAHVRAHKGIVPGIRILFDLPVKADGPDGSTIDEEPKDGSAGGPDLSGPGVPEDLEHHIHAGVDDPDEALDALIGMSRVKDEVRRMKNRVEFFGDAKSAGNGGNHMEFLGAAGTGKTEIARIITRILYDFGYIRENRLIEVDGDYLKSPYTGQTGQRVAAIVRAAKGGVLFIDEAYLLFDEKANNSVGKEATGVLLKAMEDDRDDLVVILAGYEEAMTRLIASNEGFASRIKHKIYFDDYTADELGQIFKYFLAKNQGLVNQIDAQAYNMLVEHFEMERKMPGFGNARAARNSLDKLMDIHADRYQDGKVTEADKPCITVGDMSEFLGVEEARIAADGRSFMASSHLDESIISLTELKSRTMDGAADPDGALGFLVGMEGAKEEIRGFLRRAEFFREQNLSDDSHNLNCLLVGEPGVGKSTCAGIITGYLHKAGYIRENRYLDITGDFLKASYVGQTGKRTEAIIEYSKGMVLFIDEAYLLDTAGGTGHDFGAEALGVLVNAMEKAQGELVVILAGYEAEMDSMLERNPGMKSRIGTTIHLADYTPKELCAIYKRIAKLKGFAVEKSIYQPMANYMVPLMGTRSFGNARFVRQLVEDCISAHADRYAEGGIQEGKERTLELADLERVIAKRS